MKRRLPALLALLVMWMGELGRWEIPAIDFEKERFLDRQPWVLPFLEP